MQSKQCFAQEEQMQNSFKEWKQSIAKLYADLFRLVPICFSMKNYTLHYVC